MEKSILTIQNLTLSLDGTRILDNLNLDLWQNHVHAIVGTNGAGKTTLVHTIMGLTGYTDFDGEILFEGTTLKGLSLDRRARLGMTLAWQEPARFEGLKIRDFIRAAAIDREDDSIRHALQTVGLNPDNYLERAVDKTLSGGERKKVELASILVMRPKLAFMDEPDSGIDIDSITKIFEVVKQLKEHGTTIVFITHSLSVLEQADHAFLLCHGKLVDKGSVDRISRYFTDECMPCCIHDPEKKMEPTL
ncbi:MAG: ATP-binding cassette domain-containing protein [Spirochaetota bacterium]